jgi:hypothetical protein
MIDRMQPDDGDSIQALVLRGVEIMTAYFTTPTPELARDRATSIYEEEHLIGLARTIRGLIYVAAHALARLAKVTGKSELEHLQEIAQQHLR